MIRLDELTVAEQTRYIGRESFAFSAGLFLTFIQLLGSVLLLGSCYTDTHVSRVLHDKAVFLSNGILGFIGLAAFATYFAFLSLRKQQSLTEIVWWAILMTVALISSVANLLYAVYGSF